MAKILSHSFFENRIKVYNMVLYMYNMHVFKNVYVYFFEIVSTCEI